MANKLAGVFRSKGWTQGRLGEPSYGYCLLGGLQQVLVERTGVYVDPYGGPALQEARELLANIIITDEEARQPMVDYLDYEYEEVTDELLREFVATDPDVVIVEFNDNEHTTLDDVLRIANKFDCAVAEAGIVLGGAA